MFYCYILNFQSKTNQIAISISITNPFPKYKITLPDDLAPYPDSELLNREKDWPQNGTPMISLDFEAPLLT